MPATVTASELQRNMGSVYEKCRSTREPVYVTRNGVADLVIMDAQAFEERDRFQKLVMEREMRVHDALIKSEEEVARGAVKDLDQIRRERQGL